MPARHSDFAACHDEVDAAAGLPACQPSTVILLQIMMRLTQQQDRPEIPSLDSLPGQPLPGIGAYLHLMQVFPAYSLQ